MAVLFKPYTKFHVFLREKKQQVVIWTLYISVCLIQRLIALRNVGVKHWLLLLLLLLGNCLQHLSM